MGVINGYLTFPKQYEQNTTKKINKTKQNKPDNNATPRTTH